MGDQTRVLPSFFLLPLDVGVDIGEDVDKGFLNVDKRILNVDKRFLKKVKLGGGQKILRMLTKDLKDVDKDY